MIKVGDNSGSCANGVTILGYTMIYLVIVGPDGNGQMREN
jgi:hypothetical protein